MPKRRRSDSSQHQLEREARQSAAAAELMGNMREGAPDHLTGNERRNFVSPVIRLARGAAVLVRHTIRMAASAPDVEGSDPPTIASMANKLVVLGGWLTRGDDAFVEFSDHTVEGYRHLVGLVRAEWEAERESRSSPNGVRWSRGTERDSEVVQLVAALSGGSVPEDKRPYRFLRYLEGVSRRQATAATLTENLRGGAPDHLAGDDRRNFLSPAVRLKRETARLVRRMIFLTAGGQYGYRGDPHSVGSMANLLLLLGGWLVFRDEAFDKTAPGARENCIKQAASLRATRIIEADLLSESSTAAVRSGPPQATDQNNQTVPVAGQVAASLPAAGSAPTTPPVVPALGTEALRLWAARLGIKIEWMEKWRGYSAKERCLVLPMLRNEADQLAVILVGMVQAAPSIQELSREKHIAAGKLAAHGFASRLEISDLMAMRADMLKWDSPEDYPELRAPAQEGVNWLWHVFQNLPAAAFLDLFEAKRRLRSAP